MGFVERFMRPLTPISTSGWVVKGYGVTVEDRELDPEALAVAMEFLPKLLPPPNTDGTPSVAFSVVHHGQDAVWLNVYAWCQEAILGCRAANAPLTGSPVFEPLVEPLIGCVWELPAVVHERSAWVRHLLQPQRPDVDAYLSDVRVAGPVGAP